MEKEIKLTAGDRQYLKGHGISEKEFNKMDGTAKTEWKEECQLGAYKKSWSRKEAVGRLPFKRIGSATAEMELIWRKKRALIAEIIEKHKNIKADSLQFNTLEQLNYILKNGLRDKAENMAEIRNAILQIKA